MAKSIDRIQIEKKSILIGLSLKTLITSFTINLNI